MDIDLMQTSRGFGVPLFDYKAERPSLDQWTDAKGPDGIEVYRRENNTYSMDGLPRGVFDDTWSGREQFPHRLDRIAIVTKVALTTDAFFQWAIRHSPQPPDRSVPSELASNLKGSWCTSH
ncbi:hypothetical protein [Rhizobium sp. P40RR-XXII]|uniref:hypothetical protein n=1 Tax=Rhizobium sp. P40RR-XXII TaxID=2726739 RepID=UPI001FEF7511|nr:hypothetical protein [Rhizobium sp. P40RR-XXII]